MESTGTTAPVEPTPINAAPTSASAAPTHKSPIDQVKDAATKVLALITGRK
jgi:hypothetical protein